MAGENSKENNEADEIAKIRVDLESKLNAQPTLDTEIPEFLAISGIFYQWEPLRHSDVKKIKDDLEKARRDRRSFLTRDEKSLEVRLSYALLNSYYRDETKTLGELKEIVETKGVGRMSGFGLKGLAYFNRILEQFGIEAFGVAHAGFSPETLAKRYGLHPPKR